MSCRVGKRSGTGPPAEPDAGDDPSTRRSTVNYADFQSLDTDYRGSQIAETSYRDVVQDLAQRARGR